VIVVIGALRLRGSGDDSDAAGLVSSVATAAAAEDTRVEVIARLGDDPAGDAVLLSLARQKVGHVAVLRDLGDATTIVPDDAVEIPDPAASEATVEPTSTSTRDAPHLEAADANLALRYLPQIGVVVAVHLPDDVLAEAIAAATWAETALVVIVPPGAAVPTGLPPTAVTLEIDDQDESAAGAAVGRYVAALDRGDPPRDAFEALVASVSA
jgi:hypothetical protein